MRQARAVTPFDCLRDQAERDRLEQLASSLAQTEFGLSDATAHLVTQRSFNTVLRLETGDGRTFSMRIGNPVRIHPTETESVEAAWLDAITDSGLVSPRCLRATNGSCFAEVAIDSATPRRCSIFSWMPGEMLGTDATATSIASAGALLAQLHIHAAESQVGASADKLRADRVLYFHPPNEMADRVSSHGQLFADAVDRIQTELDAIWQTPPHRPHLLHGDFGPNNIVVDNTMAANKVLRPIDFQDLRLGFAFQDVAITMADLSRTAPDLVEPFLAGYRTVRACHEFSPSERRMWTAARSLNIINFGLHVPKPGLIDMIERHARWVREFVDSYSL